MRSFSILLLPFGLLIACDSEEGIVTEIPGDDTGISVTYTSDQAGWTGSSSSSSSGSGSGGTDTDDTDAGSGSDGEMVTWYADCDGDGRGSSSHTRESVNKPTDDSCSAGSGGWAEQGGDCDDTNSSASPNLSEVTGDGVDNDCDGSVDEGGSANTCYEDDDRDGYGNPSASVSAASCASGYVTNNDDCDDTSASAHPGGSEGSSNDGLDNDCDGYVDDGLSEEVEICARSGSNIAEMEVMVRNETRSDDTYWGGLGDWSDADNTEVYTDYDSSDPDDLAEAFTVEGANQEKCWTYANASPGDFIEVQAYVRKTDGTYTWGVHSSYALFTATLNGNTMGMSGNDYGDTAE